MVPRRRAMLVAAALLCLPSAASAQAREPIGRFVLDVRGTSAGLPTEPGWTPVVPTGTQLPARGIGIDVGAHVYPIRVKSAAIGIGAAWGLARGRTSPPEPPSGSTTPIVQAPAVTTRTTSFAPQVSLNFGHALGWSYLSAGLGRTRVESSAEALRSTIQSVPLESGWTKSINFGGGARWFVNDRVGVGFDLRWHKLSLVPASPTHPGAPRASLLTAAVGLSIK